MVGNGDDVGIDLTSSSFTVLTIQPDMVLGEWLLVALIAGERSFIYWPCSGVTLTGQENGKYTFFSHLKWTTIIALGYIASIFVTA